MSADTKSAKKRAFQARVIGPATINNPTESDYEACRSPVDNKTLKYITFNLEVGEDLQLHAIASKLLTMTAWQKALGGRAANIVNTISPEDCRDYCQGFKVKSERQERKEGSQATDSLSMTDHPGYEEYGTHNAPGTRTDLTRAITAIQNGTTIDELIEEMSGTVNGAYRTRTEYKQRIIHRTAKQQVLDDYKDVQWKPFQQQIIDHLDTKPDGRTLNWYHESNGNIGKSYLTKYLMATDQAYYPDITKPADIFCGYNLQPIPTHR